MDREIRNLLERTTQQARRLLEAEYARQLEGTFDILPDGTIHAAPGAHLSPDERFLRSRLVAAIEHRRAGGESAEDSVANFLRECAFTFLNRIVALRMLEARGIIKPSVSNGEESSGFINEYLLLAPGLRAFPDKGYRLYLESLFDEMSREVGVLFDRTDLAGQFWPDRPKFLQLLELLNNRDLETVWEADETIGWIYQYFNSDDERRQMRADSPAPRNSREMAVRNQFFTPRYIVEFLTDNTLGRTWYEMRQGQTALKERCQYLVRRPNEEFLRFGQETPEHRTSGEQTQEELLRESLLIPYRAAKDPREIRVLDPACGSGHFLLYCFDLLEIIYEEAWDSGIGTVRDDFQEKEQFICRVPELILRHNLHGIDIDPRAAQIGSLALWMRAQRSWIELPRAERPQIRRTNIVVAEPMPGETDLLDEFCEGLEEKLLGQLVREVFSRMKIAGDAGSLLQIETDIAEMVEEARVQWLAEEAPTDRSGNPLLFASSRQRTIFETERISADFWAFAEQRVFDELGSFAAAASNGKGFRRHLFVDDAERGFAFIDMCRKRFDVILMNPPFGDRPVVCDKYLSTSYPKTSVDIYSMFFERSIRWLHRGGKVGAISNRTWLGLPSFEELRREIFGKQSCVECAADLGSFVLEAQVETAAIIVGESTRADHPAIWIRLLKTKSKDKSLADSIHQLSTGIRHRGVYVSSQSRFRSMPTAVFGYWMSDRLIATFRPENSVESRAATVKQGTATADDFRFLRLAWEVSPASIGNTSAWMRFAKGGEYSPFYDDIHLLLKWANEGNEIIAWGKGRPQNIQFFGRSGVTWPRRTTSAFSPRALPADCAFGDKGPAAFPHAGVSPELLLGVLVSRPSRLLLSVRLGAGDDAPGSASKSYEVGLIRDLPFPELPQDVSDQIRKASSQCARLAQEALSAADESSALFLHPFAHITSTKLPDILGLTQLVVERREQDLIDTADSMQKIDEVVADSLGFTEEDRQVLDEELDLPLASMSGRLDVSPELFSIAYLEKSAVPGDSLPGGIDAEQDVRVQTRRKKQTASLRSEDVICRLFEVTPRQFASTRMGLGLLRREDLQATAKRILSYAVGVSFQRFDIQFALNRCQVDPVSPYAALPSVAPGLIRDLANQTFPEGEQVADLDFGPGSVKHVTPGLSRTNISDDPIDAPFDGILHFEVETHSTSINRKGIVPLVSQTIQLLWGDNAASVEQQICEALHLQELSEYFRQSSGFFQDHLKTYSKSRRNAPIYWQLSVPSGKYGIWVYYHRFTRDTFWRLLNEFVKPKFAQEELRLAGVRSEAGEMPTPSQRRAIQEQEVFVSELATFRDDIEAVAPLWNPSLDDGVLINFAPLWKLAPQLPSWRKEVRETWQGLCRGDYDWSHLSMHLWPERVVPRCADDRSLAIAHGLEDTFWREDNKGKWLAKKVSSTEVKTLIEERASKAVKTSLDKLLAQSASTPTAKRARSAARRNS